MSKNIDDKQKGIEDRGLPQYKLVEERTEVYEFSSDAPESTVLTRRGRRPVSEVMGKGVRSTTRIYEPKDWRDPKIIEGHEEIYYEEEHEPVEQSKERTEDISDADRGIKIPSIPKKRIRERKMSPPRDVSPEEEEIFTDEWFERIGLKRSIVEDLKPSVWELWKDYYFKYVRTLSVEEKNNLHREIDRFFFMAMDKRFIADFEMHQGKRIKKLRREYTIPKSEHYSIPGSHGDYWLKIAALYLEGQKRKERAEKEKTGEELFLFRMPPEWLKSIRTNVSENELTDYERFVIELNGSWDTFIKSYNVETHCARLSDRHIECASLDSFLEGRNRKTGAKLTRPPRPEYWPKPIKYYKGFKTARELFKDSNEEYGLYCFQHGHPTNQRRTWQEAPKWMKMGTRPP